MPEGKARVAPQAREVTLVLVESRPKVELLAEMTGNLESLAMTDLEKHARYKCAACDVGG